MDRTPHNHGKVVRRDDKPWYKQFWPWFIISFPAASVVASLALLWVAISNPDSVVPNEHENRFLDTRFTPQTVSGDSVNKEAGKPGAATKP